MWCLRISSLEVGTTYLSTLALLKALFVSRSAVPGWELQLRVAEGCVNEHYRAKSKYGWCRRDMRDCWHIIFCWLLCRCHVVFNLRIYLHVLLIIIPVLCLAHLVALLIVGICRSTVIWSQLWRRRALEWRKRKYMFCFFFLSLYFSGFAKLLV